MSIFCSNLILEHAVVALSRISYVKFLGYVFATLFHVSWKPPESEKLEVIIYRREKSQEIVIVSSSDNSHPMWCECRCECECSVSVSVSVPTGSNGTRSAGQSV